MWEIDKAPENTVMDSDAGLFLRRDPSDPRPDLMYHIYTVVCFFSLLSLLFVLIFKLHYFISHSPIIRKGWDTTDQKLPCV